MSKRAPSVPPSELGAPPGKRHERLRSLSPNFRLPESWLANPYIDPANGRDIDYFLKTLGMARRRSRKFRLTRYLLRSLALWQHFTP